MPTLSTDTSPAEKLAQELSIRLLSLKRRLTTVESCTGGGIAYLLTDIPGSSRWFERAFITYSNDAKTEMVGVSRPLLQQHGAVSAEVACAMANGGLQHSRADYCVAVTGIAGPDGGNAEKPVGTVFFAWATHASVQASKVSEMRFSGDRHAIRQQSIAYALRELLDFITNPK